MSPLDLLAVLGVVSVPLSVGLTVAWLGARREVRLLRELMHDDRLAATSRRTGSVERDADLLRVESAVEAIAIEMERVAEGQRFMSRVLAERRDAAGALPPGRDESRSITPR